MQRCCPVSCGTGELLESACNALPVNNLLGQLVGNSSGAGTCTYPNDAQCTPTYDHLSCSSSDDQVVNNQPLCPNVLFVSDYYYESYQPTHLGHAIFNALNDYITSFVVVDKACIPAATLVDTIENLPGDLTPYTQIWVYDVDQQAELAGNVAKWQSIAQWFQAGYPATRQHIIMDGRISSSIYNARVHNVGPTWLAMNHKQIFANYFENLHKHGGGLVLGTDHGGPETAPCGAYTCGINTVTRALNIGKFWGHFQGLGVAYVDVDNPLMNFPLDATEDAASRSMPVFTCTNAALCVPGTVFDRIMWDHTTTSQTAIGLQPNGMTFYAAAFHSQDTNKPAISSTFRGGLNFQTEITQPECDQCFAVGATVTIVVTVHVSSIGPYSGWNATYTGNSFTSPTGNPGSAFASPTAFSVAADGLSAMITTLPLGLPGSHGFEVQVTDAQGSVATSSIRVTVGDCAVSVVPTAAPTCDCCDQCGPSSPPTSAPSSKAPTGPVATKTPTHAPFVPTYAPTVDMTEEPTMAPPTNAPTAVAVTKTPTIAPSTKAPSSVPMPWGTLPCTNETVHVNARTECPNVLFVAHCLASPFGWSNWEPATYCDEIFTALSGYVNWEMQSDNEGSCAPGDPQGVTKVDGIANLPSDLSSFTQVWVIDFDAHNERPSETVQWQSIAQWFQSGYPATRQHVILDGRVISSTSAPHLPTARQGAAQLQVFSNYFKNLRAHGGGLMLGTGYGGGWSHPCGGTTCGINTLMAGLQIYKFIDNFQGHVAYADSSNPLMSVPLDATQSAVAFGKQVVDVSGSTTLSSATAIFDRIVWDEFLSSQTALGLQANGMTFYTVAFHELAGMNLNAGSGLRPAISSTFRSLVNFQIAITQPVCGECFAVGHALVIVVAVHIPSNGPYTGWTAAHLNAGSGSNLIASPTAFTVASNGLSATITTLPLYAGEHIFEVRVTDSIPLYPGGPGSVASYTVRVSAGECTGAPSNAPTAVSGTKTPTTAPPTKMPTSEAPTTNAPTTKVPTMAPLPTNVPTPAPVSLPTSAITTVCTSAQSDFCQNGEYEPNATCTSLNVICSCDLEWEDRICDPSTTDACTLCMEVEYPWRQGSRYLHVHKVDSWSTNDCTGAPSNTEAIVTKGDTAFGCGSCGQPDVNVMCTADGNGGSYRWILSAIDANSPGPAGGLQKMTWSNTPYCDRVNGGQHAGNQNSGAWLPGTNSPESIPGFLNAAHLYDCELSSSGTGSTKLTTLFHAKQFFPAEAWRYPANEHFVAGDQELAATSISFARYALTDTSCTGPAMLFFGVRSVSSTYPQVMTECTPIPAANQGSMVGYTHFIVQLYKQGSALLLFTDNRCMVNFGVPPSMFNTYACSPTPSGGLGGVASNGLTTYAVGSLAPTMAPSPYVCAANQIAICDNGAYTPNVVCTGPSWHVANYPTNTICSCDNVGSTDYFCDPSTLVACTLCRKDLVANDPKRAATSISFARYALADTTCGGTPSLFTGVRSVSSTSPRVMTECTPIPLANLGSMGDNTHFIIELYDQSSALLLFTNNQCVSGVHGVVDYGVVSSMFNNYACSLNPSWSLLTGGEAADVAYGVTTFTP